MWKAFIRSIRSTSVRFLRCRYFRHSCGIASNQSHISDKCYIKITPTTMARQSLESRNPFSFRRLNLLILWVQGSPEYPLFKLNSQSMRTLTRTKCVCIYTSVHWHVSAPTKPKRPLSKQHITLKPSAANSTYARIYHVPHIWVQNCPISCVSHNESLALEQYKTRANSKINKNQ